MFFSSTGIAYLILSFSLGFLTVRFFQYWKDKRDITSKIFFFFTFCFTVFSLVRMFTSLFFLDNIGVLLSSIYFVAFLQGLAASFVAYLIFYLKFPKTSPWIGFFSIFVLTLIIVFLSFYMPYEVIIGEFGTIYWGFSSSSYFSNFYSLLRMIIILITFAPLSIIMFQQTIKSKDFSVRKKAIGLNTALIAGMVIGFIDFIMVNVLNFNILYRDIIVSFLGVILLFFTIFIQNIKKDKVKI